jgi:hypothetical protein
MNSIRIHDNVVLFDAAAREHIHTALDAETHSRETARHTLTRGSRHTAPVYISARAPGIYVRRSRSSSRTCSTPCTQHAASSHFWACQDPPSVLPLPWGIASGRARGTPRDRDAEAREHASLPRNAMATPLQSTRHHRLCVTLSLHRGRRFKPALAQRARSTPCPVRRPSYQCCYES